MFDRRTDTFFVASPCWHSMQCRKNAGLATDELRYCCALICNTCHFFTGKLTDDGYVIHKHGDILETSDVQKFISKKVMDQLLKLLIVKISSPGNITVYFMLLYIN